MSDHSSSHSMEGGSDADASTRTVLMGSGIVLAIGVLAALVVVVMLNKQGDSVLSSHPPPHSDHVIGVDHEMALERLPHVEAGAPAIDAATTPIEPTSTARSEVSRHVEEDDSIDVLFINHARLSDWREANDVRRKRIAELFIAMVALVDPDVRFDEGALSLPEFFDQLPETMAADKLTSLTDRYLDHARGVLDRFSGNGPMTTDAFEYDGDGYVIYLNSTKEDVVFGLSVYDEVSAEIVKANILSSFGHEPVLFTRLRLSPGRYYFEVNASGHWECILIAKRGMEWIKRKAKRVEATASAADEDG